MHKFGVHVSIAGGIDKAPERAKNLGCDIFQIFVSNPRSWKEPSFTSDMATKFKQKVKDLELARVIIHATYLPNPANPDREAHNKAVSHLKKQYKAGKDIAADYFVIHPGSHKKSGLKSGINQISKALNEITEAVPDGPVWLIENTAGGGDTIGKDTDELIMLIKKCNISNDKIGICLDSCHAFASGIDITNNKILNSFCQQLETNLYKGVIKLLHLNDSKFELNKNRDRHEHIGLGRIGEKGMHTFLNNKVVRNLPVILETPVDEKRDDPANIQAAKRLSMKHL